jgi:predicted acetyltransferase
MPVPPRHLRLVPPSRALLADYADALARGWSPNTEKDVSRQQLGWLRRDPAAFLADLVSQQGRIAVGDGRIVPRLPFFLFWITDGDFAGSINLRYRPGSETLPDYCSGHIGYAVVPWKRRRGYATWALGAILAMAPEVGLRRVSITCDEDNDASRRVIEANGGRLVGLMPNRLLTGRRKLVFHIMLDKD